VSAARAFAGAALAVAAVLCACSRPAGTTIGKSPGAPLFVAGIAPIAYFVERIGGDAIRVDVLVEPGRSPHAFSPTPKQVAGLASASGFIAIGLPFEQRLVEKIRASFPSLPICNAAEGVELLAPIAHEHHDEEGHEGHDHAEAGHAEHHERESFDPHVWLDPKRARRIAANIAAALSAAMPAQAATFSENLAALDAELAALDAELTERLAPLRGRAIIVFHPAYAYFAESYGLTQVAIEVGGKDPTPTDVVRVVNEARRTGVRVIFYQPQYSSRSAEVIASEIGGVVEPLDPLAKDYLAQLRHMGERVASVLGGENP